MGTHPVQAAWALGAAPDIANAEESYFIYVAQSISDITAKDLDRTFVIHLMLSGGGYAVYHYDPTNTDPEDGDLVILDSDDRPFVRQSSSSGDGASVINVINYGATGDGVTDDTAAIQAAIDVVRVSSGVIFAPKGSYVISSLDLTDCSSVGIIFRGDGFNTVFLPKSGTSSYGTSTGHLFDLTGSNFIELRDFRIGVYNQTPEPTSAIFCGQVASNAANALHFENLYVSGKYTSLARARIARFGWTILIRSGWRLRFRRSCPVLPRPLRRATGRSSPANSINSLASVRTITSSR